MALLHAEGYGRTRKAQSDGRSYVQILTVKGWANYPATAKKLAEFAENCGWTVDSHGLPLRTNLDGDLILALIFSRKVGFLRDDEISDGYEIRVSWVCDGASFHLVRPLYKSTRHGWTDTMSSLKDVQRLISDHPVRQG